MTTAGTAEVLICAMGKCAEPAQPDHSPCCSSHGIPLCCRHYTRRHFVEVDGCSSETHEVSR